VPDDPPDGPVSALPPVGARVLAFVAILVGGACGGLIGAGVVDVQCTGDCTTPASVGALTGAITGALGVAVVAVLALRAMGEWRTIEHGKAADRPYVLQAEDARGVSLLGKIRGDDLPAIEPEPPPPELAAGDGGRPTSTATNSEQDGD
jgi:hypothetical protein